MKSHFLPKPNRKLWMARIAERAGVSKGTLYNYFDSKREFLGTVTLSFQRRSLSDQRVRADQGAAVLA